MLLTSIKIYFITYDERPHKTPLSFVWASDQVFFLRTQVSWKLDHIDRFFLWNFLYSGVKIKRLLFKFLNNFIETEIVIIFDGNYEGIFRRYCTNFSIGRGIHIKTKKCLTVPRILKFIRINIGIILLQNAEKQWNLLKSSNTRNSSFSENKICILWLKE
jgi:hypothetical protein